MAGRPGGDVADEVRERWERPSRYVATLTGEDLERGRRERTARMIRMAELMVAGAPVDDPAVQAEVHSRYEAVCRFWTPDAEAFRTLGRTYAEDEQWRATYERIAVGLSEYQRDAMAAYADARLG